jgi:putative membrane protein (TIGR04086 family)
MMNAMEKVKNVRIGSPILSGIVYALCCLCILTLGVSFVLLLTQMTETSLSLYVYIMHGIALLIGGFIAGKRAAVKGWYYGGIVGVIYGIFIVLVGFLGFDSAMMTLESLTLLVMSFVLASVGGILGVNVNK